MSGKHLLCRTSPCLLNYLNLESNMPTPKVQQTDVGVLCALRIYTVCNMYSIGDLHSDSLDPKDNLTKCRAQPITPRHLQHAMRRYMNPSHGQHLPQPFRLRGSTFAAAIQLQSPLQQIHRLRLVKHPRCGRAHHETEPSRKSHAMDAARDVTGAPWRRLPYGFRGFGFPLWFSVTSSSEQKRYA